MSDPLVAPLDPELDALRAAAASRGLPPMVALSPDEARQRVAAGDRWCAAGPDVTTYDATVDVDGHRLPLRVYAATRPTGVTLVHCHGGGWVTGDLAYSDELCRFLAAEAGCTVVGVDYRLAPEHPFPAALDDVLAAVRWAADLEGTRAVAVSGDSAGGNLAAAAVLRLRDAGGPVPSFQLLAYPALDREDAHPSYVDQADAFPVGAADMRWFLDHYVPAARRDDPAVAPLRAADLTGLPRTHVVTVGHDPLRDEGRAYASRLAGAGAVVSTTHHPALCHGFLRFTGASARARAARAELVGTVRALVGATVAASHPA